jgi:CRP-like cAMP-binding protein
MVHYPWNPSACGNVHQTVNNNRAQSVLRRRCSAAVLRYHRKELPMNLSQVIFDHTGIALLCGPGETIFHAGDAAHEMYLVLEGNVELYNAGQLVAVLGAGQIIDELALLDGGSRTTTAIAREGAILVPIDVGRFELINRHVPTFALSVIRSLAARLSSPSATEPLRERSVAA